ncbi:MULTISPECIES: hypothetical protein [Agrobacterium tumefaciens complex]|jgi:hypothetical protein|uniref:Uncharacterized protein n=1 Tax=Agrobacterium radiobacter TaxID=362 RepID=A0ABD5LI16_AGRRD|nr:MULTISPECIES: hypothetical protein [Agrobacterium tumefaciens complex]MCP2137096.1 hypothetical protein [Rhizobium sp. SLBN-94]TGE79233.1 hypothetical protein C9410_13995 [Rhizobium sp. SEMIA 439]EPR19531.1 hypothetical protein L902_10890 [Agrobacterium radiobacter DSM 30147]KAB0461462.1 hypothetical protein F7R04_06660 [Agrobacterium tumefaciens]KWT77758.1 hypothetical protein ASH09_09245 [Agrobacterium radiobacter]
MNGKQPIAMGGLTRRNLLSAAPLALVAASGLQAIPARAQPAASANTEAFLDSIGVCGHFTRTTGVYPEQFNRIMPEIEALGVRHLRDDGLIAARNSPVFQRLRRIVAAGLRLTIICYDNLNPYVSTPLDRLADFYDWSDAGIDIFEGSNEPNLTKDPQNAPRISAEHQAALHAAVRSIPRLSAVRVAAPSYVLENRALALDLKDVCDYGNIHPYAGMEHPETTGPGALSKSVAASAHIAAGRPVLATEMGYHTSLQTETFHFPVTEGIKARYMPRMLLWCFISGIRRSYIYEMVSSFAADETNPESSFGLLRHDLSRTPAYEAVRALLSLCKAERQTGQEERQIDFLTADPQRLSLHLARPDGALLVPVWLGISGWQWPARIENPPAERVATFSVAGQHSHVVAHRFRDDGSVSQQTITQESGQYRLSVSDQLTVLEVF